MKSHSFTPNSNLKQPEHHSDTTTVMIDGNKYYIIFKITENKLFLRLERDFPYAVYDGYVLKKDYEYFSMMNTQELCLKAFIDNVKNGKFLITTRR